MTLLFERFSMQKRAAFGAVSTLLLVAAACGEPFAIVGGGGGGAGGGGATGGAATTSSSSTSASSSSSSGTAQGDKCSPTAQNPCDPGLYCATKDCKSGTCEPVPAAQGQQWSPVCGCDGILYWNADLAIASSVSFELTADCNQSNLQKCSLTSNPCAKDDGVYCNLHAGGSTSVCTPPTGFCTKLPDTCDGTGLTGKECAMPTGECRSACELVRNGAIWYTPDPACTL